MRVLVGIEGSDESAIVLENAVSRAREAGDDLTIAIFAKPDTDQDLDAIEADVRESFDGSEVSAAIERIESDPASELVAMAERGAYDQLVIGGGRDTPLGKRYLGRISEFVLLNADITVRVER